MSGSIRPTDIGTVVPLPRRKSMFRKDSRRPTVLANLGIAAVLFFSGVAAAQSTQIQGLIVGRSGANMTVQLQGSETIVVTLTTDTQVDVSRAWSRMAISR
jgi:hypothetical protein